MKRIYVLVLLLLTITCTGCVEKKIAVQNSFYSTQAPALSVTMPDNVKFIGETSSYAHKSSIKRYYYAAENETHYADRISIFETLTIPRGYYWQPKHLPVGIGPHTNIYTKDVDGEPYYCRLFLTTPEDELYDDFSNEFAIRIPDVADVMVCTKLISSTKKIMFAYIRETDTDKLDGVFDYKRYNPNAMTSEQTHYFNDVDEELSSEFIMNKFQDSDLN